MITETAAVALATLFATIGPFDVAAMFAVLTAENTKQQRRLMAIRGTMIATVVLLVFALFGNVLLSSMGISLAALSTAGGVLLLLLQKPDYKDGSKNAPSGRGFFAGQAHGMDVMVKDSSRFAKTNGWGFFNFGHHAPAYEKSAMAAPEEACAACHTAHAHKDMVFASYYPVLNLLRN
ncbi:MarC family protein [uncultured Cycloclasticus sp.]|uniref:MarC family protein n=1 Tax=uncultured Cycloclasticus sp. TaxID=172194 RepID=UPI002588592B|nr:MarC family protein [uncultured Cycloclasticus sp.]